MDSNFFEPPNGFPQPRVIREHLVGAINIKHVLLVEMYCSWLLLGFSMPVDKFNKLRNVGVGDYTNISLVFPFSYGNVM